MRILILGFSNIVRRRALPALLECDLVSGIDIASQHGAKETDLPETWEGKIYKDYSTALKESNAEIVYISLINSLHEHWAESALLAKRHVIIDKPALLSLAATERLLATAQDSGLCLAEATVFNFHPQYDEINELLDHDTRLTRVIMAFSFPPFAATDFRNFPELGGGALLDLGPYAAATSRLFFSEPPNGIVCRINSWHPETKVETAFSLLVNYPGGGSYVGHFGFDTEYQNRLIAFGTHIAITMDRAFTTPPDMENRIEVKQDNATRTIKARRCDTFKAYFTHVMDCIGKRDWRSLTDNMLLDASFREQLQLSAYEEYK